jgi:hypothetical protein
MFADISEEYSASIFREEEKNSIEKYGMNIGSGTTWLGNLFFQVGIYIKATVRLLVFPTCYSRRKNWYDVPPVETHRGKLLILPLSAWVRVQAVIGIP